MWIINITFTKVNIETIKNSIRKIILSIGTHLNWSLEYCPEECWHSVLFLHFLGIHHPSSWPQMMSCLKTVELPYNNGEKLSPQKVKWYTKDFDIFINTSNVKSLSYFFKTANVMRQHEKESIEARITQKKKRKLLPKRWRDLRTKGTHTNT